MHLTLMVYKAHLTLTTTRTTSKQMERVREGDGRSLLDTNSSR